LAIAIELKDKKIHPAAMLLLFMSQNISLTNPYTFLYSDTSANEAN
jgi:hypothetical protein